MSIIPKSEPINQRIETDPNTINPPAKHNHSDQHGTIPNLSSNDNIKQEPTCSICSNLSCSCINQSKALNQSLRYNTDLLGSFDSSEPAENNNNKQPNFAKLMENTNKNIKESLMEETKEIISTATEEKKIEECSRVNNMDKPEPMQTYPKGHPCPLPADIPTLDSLSHTSPKLSTWRQTRIISEKLEQHLWTWRCACKKSGKRISKSLLQARAKWAFRKAGIVEFKASDGWYWKWLSKWRRKGEEIGITEQGELSHMEIQVLPPSPHGQGIKTEVKEEDLSNEVSSPSLACKPDRVETPKTESDTYEICSDCNCNTGDLEQKTEHHQEELLQIKKEPATSLQEYEAVSECSNKTFKQMDKSVDLNEEEIKKQFAYKRIYNEKGCQFSDDSSPPAKVARKELSTACERNTKEWQDEDWSTTSHNHQDLDIGLSFVPLEALDMHGTSECLEQLIPNRKIAVSDILPLTLTGNQICLAVDPTNSILPLSPIFIKTSGLGGVANVRVSESHSDGSLGCDNRPEKELFVTEYGNSSNNAFLDNLDEIASLPNEFLNIESLSNWQGDIEDIDTEQLVNALCENHGDGVIKIENINEVVNQNGSRCKSPDSQPSKNCQEELFEESPIARERSENSILPNLLNRSFDTSATNGSNSSQLSEGTDGHQEHKNTVQNLISNQGPLAKPQPLISGQGQAQRSVPTPTAPNKLENIGGQQTKFDSKPNQYLIHPCGHQCKRLKSTRETRNIVECRAQSESTARGCNKQDEEKSGGKLGGHAAASGAKQQLTVIAIHKKKGEESLNKFKEEVRKFAVDHTFKETAKKFGIHHSTVSGWVKESEKQDKCANFGDFFREKGDDKFIYWLRECRETGVQVSLGQVKNKVGEILASCGQQDVEKTCKWFLLWHNRREEKLYVEGMEDEDMKKETQNLAYPPAFKLEVALFAKKHSQYAAAKIFNVARRRIFDWMRQIPKLEELIAKGHMKKMTGRGPKNRDIDQALYTWYCERKASGNRPKSCHVQSKARELYLTYGYNDMKCSYGWFKRWSQRFQIQLRYSYDDEIIEWILSRFDGNLSVNAQDLQTYGLSLIKKEDPCFKASSGWALRFCKRHKEFLSSDGTFPSKLPPHLESRIATFRSVLLQLHREKQFPAFQVGAMDELCFHFQQASDKKSSSCVLRHPGMESSNCTVILAATADGNLLPPFVVFKSDSEPHLENESPCSPSQSVVKEEEILDKNSNEKSSTTLSKNNNNPINPLEAESQRHPQESNNLSLLGYGMTAGVVGKGEGASVGELELGVWLEHVWFKHVPQSNFLLADSFPVHTAQKTQKLLLERDSCLAIIPNACSAKLQPLHQGLKEKFKVGIEDKYLNSVGGQASKVEGRTSPTKEQVLVWVDEVFHELRQNKREIAESFRKTEIYCRASDK